MPSPPTPENMAPPTPTPRQRPNTADSEQSKESWQNLIPHRGSYAGSPMQQFFIEEQRLDRITIPIVPLGRTNFPSSSSSRSDISAAEADCGSSTTYQSDRMLRSEGSTYTTSSVPTLDNSSLTTVSSPTPSTSYNHPQMYGLQEGSSGELYTLQPIGRPVRTAARPEGTHPCLFFFNGCPEVFDRADNWVSHVDSHFVDIPLPSSCTCSVCGEPFNACDPPLNWEQFLKHTFDDHFKGGEIQEISPHPDFVAHCRDAGMISNFTCTWLEGGNQWASPEGDRSTPRSMSSRGNTEIAQVHFPSTWGPSEAQPRTGTTIVVHRSGQARGRRS